MKERRKRIEFDVTPSPTSVRDEKEIRKRKRRDERVEREERGDTLPLLIVAKAQSV
jgi:hypothetical protein